MTFKSASPCPSQIVEESTVDIDGWHFYASNPAAAPRRYVTKRGHIMSRGPNLVSQAKSRACRRALYEFACLIWSTFRHSGFSFGVLSLAAYPMGTVQRTFLAATERRPNGTTFDLFQPARTTS
jgi:hypothetical protein